MVDAFLGELKIQMRVSVFEPYLVNPNIFRITHRFAI